MHMTHAIIGVFVNLAWPEKLQLMHMMLALMCG